MNYSFDTQQKIINLKEQGYSSRSIAALMNISKSGVNDYYTKYLTNKTKSNNGPRVLFFDLETSAALVYCFGRHKQFINQDAIFEEGGKLICSGYSWLGSDEVNVLYNADEVKQQKDLTICKKMWKLFNEADIVVAHNAKGFDVKMLAVRCLANGLRTLPKVKVIDTLQLARKGFRFPSNKLDSLGAYLGVGRKVTHSGISLWAKVQQGDKQALLKMVEYCKGDVELLKDIFMILRGHGGININFAMYYADNLTRCKSCGSTNLEFTGKSVLTNTAEFEEISCLDCGSVNRSKVNKLTKNKRKSLLN
jgi:DNA polymerase elongation subunit (family B)